MAMDVEYEEYSSTSSSKHHGWKLEVSRRHRETQEMEALEARIAAEYAKIDQGLSVGDLTAPRATRLIAAMDRSARLPGAIAHGPSRDHDRVMFLTYPDREGLCGALPTLRALEESARESQRDVAEDVDVDARDAKEKKNASSSSSSSSAALAKPKDPNRNTLASRLVDAMPLVRRVDARKEARGSLVAAETNGDGDGDGDGDGIFDTAVAAFPSRETRLETRLETRGTLVSSSSSSSSAFRRFKRPDRLVEYDYSVGVDRARDLTDAELHERAGAVTVDGDVPETAFRDLNQVD